jgi:predicted anti-sigma-YlaC factor YlaD
MLEQGASFSSECQRVVEYLPWLLNGGLEMNEKSAILAHVRLCSACRDELAEWTSAFELFEHHVPSLALAEYAMGADGSLPKSLIESHVARCEACRSEVATVRSNEGLVVPFEPPQTRRRARATASPNRWAWWTAAAAGMVAATVLGSFVLRSGSLVRRAAVSQAVTPTTMEYHLFADGFESGTTGSWQIPSQQSIRGPAPEPSATNSNTSPTGSSS